MGVASDWLLVHGHNNGGRCEKCWRDAAGRYALGNGPYESHTEAYYAVMAEAQAMAEYATTAPQATPDNTTRPEGA